MQRVLSFPPPRSMGDSREFVSKRMCFSVMFALGFLAFLAGFLLGRFIFDKELELSRAKFKSVYFNKEQVFGVYKNYLEYDVNSVVEKVSDSSIQKYITLLTNKSRTDSARREAEVLRNHLSTHGFDLVSPLVERKISLAFPSSEFPNEALIQDGDGSTIFTFDDTREKYSGSDGMVNTTVIEGSIIYVNYGRDEDFRYLDSIHAAYSSKIFLMRAGEITFGEKVSKAKEHGALGILFFTDSDSTELPLVSPTDLANLQIRYGNQTDKWAGNIPILEISANDVVELFKRMSPYQAVPNSWKGGIDILYRIGPGFFDRKWIMRMKVSTINIRKTSFDILGVMRGSQEPDRYVMLSDENSSISNEVNSTSIIMEIIRVLGSLKAKGWRPHRTLIVAFWGTDGTDMHLTSLSRNSLSQILRKTVGYFKINSVDLTGKNVTFATVNPMLEKLFYESAVTVRMTNPSAKLQASPIADNLPVECGIPYINMKQFGAKSLKDVAAFWGVTIWKMIENYKLPFSMESYSKFLAHSIDVVQNRFRSAVKEPISLDTLYQSVQILIDTMHKFEENWMWTDTSKSLEMRILTDQLLEFSRSLVCRRDSIFSDQSSGNSLFSKSITGTDDAAGFGQLQDLLQDSISAKTLGDLQNQAEKHLESWVTTIQVAKDALGNGLELFVNSV